MQGQAKKSMKFVGRLESARLDLVGGHLLVGAFGHVRVRVVGHVVLGRRGRHGRQLLRRLDERRVGGRRGHVAGVDGARLQHADPLLVLD